ncbi:MAG: efflux RND transporter periplasmic adaptor subunit [Gemmatimonadetes bacterium]|nr:efflux RND transporter periplasmic adaptor subunit [Gemmatimonadota bacterium]
MPRFRTILAWLLVLAAALALVIGYRWFAARPPIVEVTTATRENVVRLLAVTGRVSPRLSYDVQPLVSGTVTRLYKAEGDRVSRGDVLATIDAAASRAGVDQATAQLAARQVEVERLQREHDRVRRLVEAGGLPERDAERARLDLESARAGVRQLEALTSEARARLRDFTLRSPIDGFVLTRPVDPGQNVTPQSVLYGLATGTGAEVEVNVDEQYLGELVKGLTARVAPLTGERTAFDATLAYIGRRVDEASGAVPVRLSFVGAAPILPAGLSVDVNLRIAEHPNATTVPREAVAGLGGDAFVMLVRADTVTRRAVQVIDWPAPRLVVREGLQPGDTLVVNPRGVRAGQVVRTRTAGDAL